MDGSDPTTTTKEQQQQPQEVTSNSSSSGSCCSSSSSLSSSQSTPASSAMGVDEPPSNASTDCTAVTMPHLLPAIKQEEEEEDAIKEEEQVEQEHEELNEEQQQEEQRQRQQPHDFRGLVPVKREEEEDEQDLDACEDHQQEIPIAEAVPWNKNNNNNLQHEVRIKQEDDEDHVATADAPAQEHEERMHCRDEKGELDEPTAIKISASVETKNSSDSSLEENDLERDSDDENEESLRPMRMENTTRTHELTDTSQNAAESSTLRSEQVSVKEEPHGDGNNCVPMSVESSVDNQEESQRTNQQQELANRGHRQSNSQENRRALKRPRTRIVSTETLTEMPPRKKKPRTTSFQQVPAKSPPLRTSARIRREPDRFSVSIRGSGKSLPNSSSSSSSSASLSPRGPAPTRRETRSVVQRRLSIESDPDSDEDESIERGRSSSALPAKERPKKAARNSEELGIEQCSSKKNGRNSKLSKRELRSPKKHAMTASEKKEKSAKRNAAIVRRLAGRFRGRRQKYTFPRQGIPTRKAALTIEELRQLGITDSSDSDQEVQDIEEETGFDLSALGSLHEKTAKSIREVIGALKTHLEQDNPKVALSTASICNCFAELHVYLSHFLDRNRPEDAAQVRTLIRTSGGAKIVSQIMQNTIADYKRLAHKAKGADNIKMIQYFGILILQDLCFDPGSEHHVAKEANGLHSVLLALDLFAESEIVIARYGIELLLNLLIGAGEKENPSPKDEAVCGLICRDETCVDVVVGLLNAFSFNRTIQDNGCAVLYRIIKHSSKEQCQVLANKGVISALDHGRRFCLEQIRHSGDSGKYKDMLEETQSALKTLVLAQDWAGTS